jgi:hypothetical protein
MEILGSIGKLYTFVLLVILFLGSGLAAWAGIIAIVNKKDIMKEKTDKIKENLSVKLQSITNKMNQQADSLDKNKNIIGGFNMKNNGFIKLAVFSFVGIIISAAILTVLPKFSNQPGNMNMNSGYSTTAMSNMSMSNQSNMSGMSNYNAQGSMNSNANLNSIQQQLNNMQQQIYQLQNQMNNSSMNSMQSNSGSSMNNSTNSNSSNSGSMNNGSSSSMSSMPMM